MLGSLGMVYGYMHRLTSAQRQLREVLLLLERALYALGQENKLLLDFLEEEEVRFGKGSVVGELLALLRDALQSDCCIDGEQMFRSILAEQKENWAINEEERYFVGELGRGLFGANKEENLAIFQSIKHQLEQRLEQRKREAGTKKKLWGTTGMLAALMLVILLW